MGKIEAKQDWIIDKLRVEEEKSTPEKDALEILNEANKSFKQFNEVFYHLKESVLWMKSHIQDAIAIDKNAGKYAKQLAEVFEEYNSKIENAASKNAAEIKKEVKAVLKELAEIDIKESAILAAREVVMLINDFSEAYKFIKNVQSILGDTDLKAFEALPNLKVKPEKKCNP